MRGREAVAARDAGGELSEGAAEHGRLAGAVQSRSAFVVLGGVLLRRRDVLEVAVGQTHDQRGAHRQSAFPRRRQHLLPHPPAGGRRHLPGERADQPIAQPEDAHLGEGRERAGDGDLVEPLPEQPVQQLALLRLTAGRVGIGGSLLETDRECTEQPPPLHPRMGVVRPGQRRHAHRGRRTQVQHGRTVAQRQGDERASELYPVDEGAAQRVEQRAGAVPERLADSHDGFARGVLAGRDVRGARGPPLPQGTGEGPVERGKHGEHGHGAPALGRPRGRHVAFGPVGEQVERSRHKWPVAVVIEVAVDVALELPFHDAVNVRVQEVVGGRVAGTVHREDAERAGGPIPAGGRIELVDPKHGQLRIYQAVLRKQRARRIGPRRGRGNVVQHRG